MSMHVFMYIVQHIYIYIYSEKMFSKVSFAGKYMLKYHRNERDKCLCTFYFTKSIFGHGPHQGIIHLSESTYYL